MILSKNDPMDVDLRLYREAILAGFFPSKEDLTNEILSDFLGNKRIILAGETAGPGRGWWGPPIGTHGTGDVGGGGGTLETTVITGRSADARDEIWDELNETWAGGPRRNMARNASEKYGNQLLVMRDEKGIAAIAGISGRPMALDESTMGFHELEHLATRESGLGRQAMAGVSAHISDIGGSGYYLHATLSAEGFYRRLGLTEVEGYSRAFKVTAGEAQKPSIVDDEPEDGVFVDKDSETDELGEAGPGRGWWGPPIGTHGTGSQGGTTSIQSTNVLGPVQSTDVTSMADLQTFAETADYSHVRGSVPTEIDGKPIYAHDVKWGDKDLDRITNEGFLPSGEGRFWASQDHLRERGTGFVLFTTDITPKRGTDVVERGLSYPEAIFENVHIPPSGIVKVVRYRAGVREDQIARYALSNQGLIDKDILALPEHMQSWFQFEARTGETGAIWEEASGPGNGWAEEG